MAPFDVFGVGNALVDIQARVDDSLVAELGFEKGIMTLVDDSQQAGVLGKLNGRSLHRCAGGICREHDRRVWPISAAPPHSSEKLATMKSGPSF